MHHLMDVRMILQFQRTLAVGSAAINYKFVSVYLHEIAIDSKALD